MTVQAKWIGLKELQAAIRRNPTVVLSEAKKYLTRGLSKYKKGIISSPWRMGGSGGGAPVSNDARYPRRYQKSKSGNLRDKHRTRINALSASIYPTASYAKYVHGIKGHPRKRSYQLRPWLDYVKDKNEHRIESLQNEFLKNITADIAK